MNYKITVVMSVYAGENPLKLERSLESVINQTYKPSEIIIVKDGKLTDELNSTLKSFISTYPQLIIVHSLSENKGLGYALNYAVNISSNEFIARMDSDDISDQYRFQAQILEFKKNPELDIVGSYAQEVDPKCGTTKILKVPLLDEDIKKYIWTCPLIHPSVMFRKESIMKIGNYDSTLRRNQDYELWYRASFYDLKFKNINKPLLHYETNFDIHKKKNTFKDQLSQLKIGFRGNKLNGLGLVSYLGVLFNFIYRVSPLFLQKKISFIVKKLDPRNK